jgi:hypothetical protein
VLIAASCGKKEPAAEGAKPPGGFEESFAGALSKAYECDLDRCIAASKAALQKLNLSVLEESGEIFKRSLDAKAADGTAVDVHVSEIGKSTTRVRIKVGSLFGDTDAARRIHSEIEAELKGGGRGGSTFSGFSGFSGFGAPTPGGTPR